MVALLALLWTLSATNFAPIQNDPAKTCPPAEMISPCICETLRYPIWDVFIECKGLKSVQELNEVVEKSEDYPFFHLRIEESTLMYIPFDVITKKHTSRLTLRRNYMTSLFDQVPPMNNSLQTLFLTDLRVQSGVRWQQLASLKNLSYLSIFKFDIHSINRSFVDNFPAGLTSLHFAKTSTRELGDKVFSKLTELTEISVAYTDIRTLKRSMFPEKTKLRSISVRNTPIRALPNDIFTDMPHLVDVNLQNTRLTTLPEKIFGNVFTTLKYLTLDGNAMDCNCDMKWITKHGLESVDLSGTCAKPHPNAGKSLKSLTQNDFSYCA